MSNTHDHAIGQRALDAGAQDMRLYIVRHGKAVDGPEPLGEFPRPEGYPSDWDRPLTPRGEAQAQFLGAQLCEQERRLSSILCSRYPRAIQTARIIAKALHLEVCTRPELEVDRPVSEALRVLDEYRGSRAVMFVGHNPQVGELLSVLGAGRGGLQAHELLVKTGELIGLDIRASAAIGSARVALRLRLGDEHDLGSAPSAASTQAALTKRTA
jgi:phosphohistidine phosphatase SixA